MTLPIGQGPECVAITRGTKMDKDEALNNGEACANPTTNQVNIMTIDDALYWAKIYSGPNELPPIGARLVAITLADEVERLREYISQFDLTSYMVGYADGKDKLRAELKVAEEKQGFCFACNAAISSSTENQLELTRTYGLDVCPGCGGMPDNGHSRDIPPVAYYCSTCMKKWNETLTN